MRKIHALWSAEDAALIDAAVVGESAFLTPATRLDFQRSGTYHILVVSGMNVSILAFVVFWVMRRLRLSDLLASLLTVMLCTAYAFVTDVGPPVWRAVLMLTIYLGVRLLYRGRSVLNALGAAALGVMVMDPKSFLGASFQLTFLSVWVLGAIAVPVLERTSQPYQFGLRHLRSADFDRTLSPRVAQLRLDLRMIAERLPQWLGGRASLAIVGAGAHGIVSVYEVLCVSASDAVRAGVADGVLLPSGNGDGNSSQCVSGAAHRYPDADGRSSAGTGLCVVAAGEIAGAADGCVTPRNH